MLGVLVLGYILFHWRMSVAGIVGKSGYFLTQEPWKYVEVFLWGLCGALVSKIIEVGSYLRWGRFYREGVVMHVAQVVTVPILALVTAMLLAQVKFTFTFAETNTITLDLAQPTIMVAVAFVIGTAPWKLWDFIQSVAGRVVPRLSEPSAKNSTPAQPSSGGA